jgi:putative exporter of polyketide antibiotics
MMRRRANRSNKTDDHLADPIDEDEQEEITRNLEHDASAQMKEINQIFATICAVASVGCLIVAIAVTRDDLTGRIHAVLAAAFHYLARQHSMSSQLNDAVVLGVALLPILLLLTIGADESEIHWSLSLGNLLTGVGVIYLRRENQSTTKAITDLNAAKYRHKSI